MRNRVFIKDRELNDYQIAWEYNKLNKGSSKFDISGSEAAHRLEGSHCACPPNRGEFVLLPMSDPAVKEGGKRYMKCRICGCYSHL